ncbi:Osiris 3 [Carabus blaptoides fortunei]
MNFFTSLCCVLVLSGVTMLSYTAAGPVAEDDIVAGEIDNSVHTNDRPQIEEALLKKLNTKCSQKDMSSCVMLKLVTYMNRMLKKASIEIGGDIEVTQTASEDEVENISSRNLDNKHETEEGQVSELIANKLWTFMRTRSLKWKIMDNIDLLVSSKPDKEGNINLGLSVRDSTLYEKGRGKKNNMGALIAAAVLKIGILKALAFKALVMLVGKALIVSKLALVLAAVIGLKKLLSQEKHVTYEVVAHPHHSHEHSYSGGGGGGGGGGHDSYSSGWGRNLAYNAHAPSE